MVERIGRERVFIYGLITRIKVWTRWLFLWILVVDKFNFLFCSCGVCFPLQLCCLYLANQCELFGISGD